VRSSLVLARKASGGPVRYCIRLSLVLASAVSSLRLCLTRLARDLFGSAQTDSIGFSSEAYGGSRKTVSQPRVAISSLITRLTCVSKLS
jgi:hypothetical protein